MLAFVCVCSNDRAPHQCRCAVWFSLCLPFVQGTTCTRSLDTLLNGHSHTHTDRWSCIWLCSLIARALRCVIAPSVTINWSVCLVCRGQPGVIFISDISHRLSSLNSHWAQTHEWQVGVADLTCACASEPPCWLDETQFKVSYSSVSGNLWLVRTRFDHQQGSRRTQLITQLCSDNIYIDRHLANSPAIHSACGVMRHSVCYCTCSVCPTQWYFSTSMIYRVRSFVMHCTVSYCPPLVRTEIYYLLHFPNAYLSSGLLATPNATEAPCPTNSANVPVCVCMLSDVR